MKNKFVDTLFLCLLSIFIAVPAIQSIIDDSGKSDHEIIDIHSLYNEKLLESWIMNKLQKPGTNNLSFWINQSLSRSFGNSLNEIESIQFSRTGAKVYITTSIAWPLILDIETQKGYFVQQNFADCFTPSVIEKGNHQYFAQSPDNSYRIVIKVDPLWYNNYEISLVFDAGIKELQHLSQRQKDFLGILYSLDTEAPSQKSFFERTYSYFTEKKPDLDLTLEKHHNLLEVFYSLPSPLKLFLTEYIHLKLPKSIWDG
jgi:hypothetical protein